jgi:hypothetical protein
MEERHDLVDLHGVGPDHAVDSERRDGGLVDAGREGVPVPRTVLCATISSAWLWLTVTPDPARSARRRRAICLYCSSFM